MTSSQHAGDSEQAYETPWPLVRQLESEIGKPFAIDVAASEANAKAPSCYTMQDNGLAQQWSDVSWCNPPYAQQNRWLARGAYFAEEHGIRSVHLVMSATSASYWHDLVHTRGFTEFFKGRISFIDPATGKTRSGTSFASALVWYGFGRLPSGGYRFRDANSWRIIGDAQVEMDLFT